MVASNAGFGKERGVCGLQQRRDGDIVLQDVTPFGRIHGLRGFGAKMEERLLNALAHPVEYAPATLPSVEEAQALAAQYRLALEDFEKARKEDDRQEDRGPPPTAAGGAQAAGRGAGFPEPPCDPGIRVVEETSAHKCSHRVNVSPREHSRACHPSP